MNIEENKNFPDLLARTLSVIFHPLFMPVYGLTIILTAPTLFSYLPFDVKKLLFLIVLVNNVLLPGSLLPFFIYRKIISSWSVSDIKERRIPLIISTILYGTTSFIIFRFPIPFFLKSFIFGVFFISIVVTLINFWWKISLHSVGIGALLSIVLVLSYKTYTPLVWFLIPVVIIGGFILSARLRLNLHNPSQVWLGFLTGLVGLTGFLVLVQ